MRQLLLYAHEELSFQESRALLTKLATKEGHELKDLISGIRLEKVEHQFESAEQHAHWMTLHRLQPPVLPTPPPRPPISITPLQFISIAASILLLIGIVYFLNRPTTPQAVFAEASLRYPHLNEGGNLRSPSQATPFDKRMNQVEENYDAKQYQQALALLEQISTDSLNNYQLTLHTYYGARLLLSTDQAEEALPILSSLAAQPSNLLYQSSLYQLGLCYLSLGDQQQIQQYFTELSTNTNANGINRRWAQEVLDQLGI
ncbi:MAG: hypothetical protein AAF587_23095 [Bacteroidota bacterium]